LPGVECIKTYADGTLGSQTASMLEPFAGQPGNIGIAFAPREKLWDIVTRSVDAGFAMSVHAIGDRANMEVLDIYEAVRRSSRGRQALLRVEHAQILRPEDMPRFGVLAVPASMQPIHLVADRAVADRYWGDRSGNAYAWKRILETGGVVAFGSDAPIESPDPLRGIHAAVTRRGPAEPESSPWYPRERLAAWQCLDCYTLGGATACGRVRDTGRVSAGYRANLTVLDTDILSVADPDEILGARVVGTVVGGVSEFYA
jgi:predicted amidohydrolase YtcJ